MVEAGRSLLLSADARAESILQTELMDVQERWRHAHHRLDKQRRELHGLLKVSQSCTWTNGLYFVALLIIITSAKEVKFFSVSWCYIIIC